MALKELVCLAPGKVSWREYRDEPLSSDEVRIRSEFGAEKHGTMAAFIKGYANERGHWDPTLNLFMPGGMAWPYPVPLGNMIVGIVTEIGASVTTLQVGDRVVCYASFRPTVTVSVTKCWKMKGDLNWETAVCLDPAAFALAAVRDGQVRLGDVAIVFGLGAIGLIAVRMARKAGATVYAVDPVEVRRQIAKDFGVAGTFNSSEDVGLKMRSLTQGRGADVAIEFSAVAQGLQGAFRAVAFGGNVVAGAFPAPYAAGLDLGAEAHLNRPNLIFSRANSEPNREHPRWHEPRLMSTAFELLCDGVVDGRRLVGTPVAFDDLLEAYPRIAMGVGAITKLGVKF